MHFRLYDLGMSQRTIVSLYYLLTALLGGVALIVSSRLLKFLVIVVLGLIIVPVLAVLSRKQSVAPKGRSAKPSHPTSQHQPDQTLDHQH